MKKILAVVLFVASASAHAFSAAAGHASVSVAHVSVAPHVSVVESVHVAPAVHPVVEVAPKAPVTAKPVVKATPVPNLTPIYVHASAAKSASDAKAKK